MVLIVYNSLLEVSFTFELKQKSSSLSSSRVEKGEGMFSVEFRLILPGLCENVGIDDRTEWLIM